MAQCATARRAISVGTIWPGSGSAFGRAATEDEYAIRNEPGDSSVLVTVIGHGVAEGHEGRYYFPSGFTLERFWSERPVPLYLPHYRIHLTRADDTGEKKRYVFDARKIESKKENPGIVLRYGDVIFVSQPNI